MKRLILIIIFLLTPTPAYAQGLNLSLSPPLLQATIKPGKSISQVFTIYNNSTNPIKLVPRVVPFLPEDTKGNPALQPQSNPKWLTYFSLINTNIKLGQAFTLPANQSDQLVLSLKIPENATQADHYATLLISSQEASPGVARQVISGSIGANILLTVATQAAPPTILKLTDLKPTNVRFIKIGSAFILDNLSPIGFTARLENLGSHLAQAHGLLQIQRGKKIVSTQAALPVYVLAQSSRELVASGSGQLSFQPSVTHLGKYTAALNVRSENGSSQTSIKLILLPVKISLGLLLAIILLKLVLTKR